MMSGIYVSFSSCVEGEADVKDPDALSFHSQTSLQWGHCQNRGHPVCERECDCSDYSVTCCSSSVLSPSKPVLSPSPAGMGAQYLSGFTQAQVRCSKYHKNLLGIPTLPPLGRREDSGLFPQVHSNPFTFVNTDARFGGGKQFYISFREKAEVLF